MRTGTKVMIGIVLFVCGCLVWLIVGIPLLALKHPQIGVYFAGQIAAIITALTGGGTISFIFNEIRKWKENSAAKKPVEGSAQ